MINRIILILIPLLLFSACASKTLYDNKSIIDPQEKKKRFEQDSLYCEVNAYKNVPEVQYQAPQNNRGSFEIKDQYGNRYDGTYQQGGGFSAAFAAGAASRQQAHLENLRQRMFKVCMNQRGWTEVIDGQEEVATKQSSKSINLNEIKDIQPIDNTNNGTDYICRIVGTIHNKKVLRVDDQEYISKNIRFITLKTLNGYRFLIDKEAGLFNDFQMSDQEIYTNNNVNFQITSKTNTTMMMVATTPDGTSEGAVIYNCLVSKPR